MSLSPGTRLGPYEVTALIGTGSSLSIRTCACESQSEAAPDPGESCPAVVCTREAI